VPSPTRGWSPGASLTVDAERRSLPSALPYGVVVDSTVCGQAPLPPWHSGVGDLVAKITAVPDWKLAFHAVGTPVNDLAALSPGTHLHGMQAGVATYLVSHLQEQGTARIASVLDRSGFWDTVRDRPFDRETWLEAVRRAPAIKPDFHTVLDEVDAPTEVARLLDSDERLRGCFV
jgi:glycerol-1-phosphate dehydrogenase [NAD(P)+]